MPTAWKPSGSSSPDPPGATEPGGDLGESGKSFSSDLLLPNPRTHQAETSIIGKVIGSLPRHQIGPYHRLPHQLGNFRPSTSWRRKKNGWQKKNSPFAALPHQTRLCFRKELVYFLGRNGSKQSAHCQPQSSNKKENTNSSCLTTARCQNQFVFGLSSYLAHTGAAGCSTKRPAGSDSDGFHSECRACCRRTALPGRLLPRCGSR